MSVGGRGKRDTQTLTHIHTHKTTQRQGWGERQKLKKRILRGR